MVVALADIPQRGLDVPLGAWAKGAAAEGLAGEVKAFEGRFLVTRHGVHIAVRGEVHVVGEVPCDRCGAPLLVSLGGDVSCVYSPVTALPETDEDTEGLPQPPVALDFRVEDVGEYDGERLDLAQVVREWATVERPIRLTCGEMDEAEEAACSARFRAMAGTPAGPTVNPKFAALAALAAPPATSVPED